MKVGSGLLALRGSVAALEGRVEEAIEDARRIQKMAAHAGSEPTSISGLVGQTLQTVALQNLAHWSLRYRSEPAYAKELALATAAMRRPNVKEEFSGELHTVLSLIELTQTPEGIAKLGLSESDLPKANLLSGLVDPEEARVSIVKAQRAYLVALESPMTGRLERLRNIEMDLFKALIAFPMAARLYEGFGAPLLSDRVEVWEAKRQQFVAVHRALSGRTIPKSIRTDDLKSPFDGKPIRYRFDGRQITVTVSGFKGSLSGVLESRFPPKPPSSK